MRILWVSEEDVDPAGGGGNIRQYHTLLRAARSEDVDLLQAGTLGPAADDVRAVLGKIVEVPRPPFPTEPTGGLARKAYDLRIALFARDSFEIMAGRNFRAALAPVLAELVRTGDYDLVHFEHAITAPLVDVVRSAGATRRPACEIVLHNLSSTRSAQQAAVAGHWRHRLLWEADARRCRRLEQGLAARFDRVIVVSPEDAAALPGSIVVPNGVDLAAFPVTPLPAEPRMLFSGTLDYAANVDGAEFLCREVLPEVRRRVPDARLSLVGRRPLPAAQALADVDGVDAAFDVPAIQPYVEAARVSVVSLRVGSGTRLKALEAMAAGRPLAGTTIGLEGLGLVDGESAVIRDDVAGLADGIARLLTDDAHAEQVRAAASAIVERYDWDAVNDGWLEAIRGG